VFLYENHRWRHIRGWGDHGTPQKVCKLLIFFFELSINAPPTHTKKKKPNIQSVDLLQHAKPMSIKESHYTRKKKRTALETPRGPRSGCASTVGHPSTDPRTTSSSQHSHCELSALTSLFCFEIWGFSKRKIRRCNLCLIM
jgi:hypothetical protein